MSENKALFVKQVMQTNKQVNDLAIVYLRGARDAYRAFVSSDVFANCEDDDYCTKTKEYAIATLNRLEKRIRAVENLMKTEDFKLQGE